MKTFKCASFTDTINIVDVESAFIKALPGFNIVGLANTTIKESEIRVKAALLNYGFKFPPLKILINLSPSDIPKNGSHFDLAIALLIALQKEEFDNKYFVFSELGLNGECKSTANLFSILLFLSSVVEFARVIVPKDIALKACMIPNFEVYSISNLKDGVEFFKNDEFKKQCLVNGMHPLFKNALEICGEKYILNFDFELDFLDIKGQQRAKRASLIAACGMHNIIFEGSPGCGKSMCAKRIHEILPPQSLNEVMLTSAYESLNNKDVDFSPKRAFRSPHHTSTKSSIFGGGSSKAKIGEVALANGGELFFDELPHFPKKILESLREPLENNKILISRVNSKVEYDTKFIFVAALNPCPCGNLFLSDSNCTCTQNEIKRYKSAISAPILDRIDLYVCMQEVSPNDKPSISSKEMYADVLRVFKMQKIRGQKEFNAKLSDEDVKKFCILDDDAKIILDNAINKFCLSQRGISKCLKVSRTIADLDNSKNIKKEHILESLSFRVRDEF